MSEEQTGTVIGTVLQKKLEDPEFRHNFVDSLIGTRNVSRATARRMEEERDAARRLAIRLFRTQEMTWQTYGEGPEIVAANPWMLQPGPWQKAEPEERDE